MIIIGVFILVEGLLLLGAWSLLGRVQDDQVRLGLELGGLVLVGSYQVCLGYGVQSPTHKNLAVGQPWCRAAPRVSPSLGVQWPSLAMETPAW